MEVFQYTLLITFISAAFGAAVGAVLSGVLFIFFGWLWSPVISWSVAIALIGGIRAYNHATTPWRG